jgi:hypothetical protein
VTVLVLSGIGACTLLLDRSAMQCRTDDDCARFGGHPFCDPKSSVCVRSGFAPADCFFGTPRTNQEFLNRCSVNYLHDEANQCLAFDNCARLGICETSTDAGTSGDAGTGVGILTPPPPVVPATPPADGGDPPTPSLPACRDPSADRGSVVYMTGSSNFLALLGKLAPIVTRRTGLIPVFRTTDSCTGARSMYPASSQTDRIIRDPAPGSIAPYAQYFLADGPHDCLLGPSGVEVHVGEAEIAAETCGLQKDSAHVSHNPGPILPILFVVPRKSLETTISAEAAREVLGNGGHVIPWTDPSLFYVRATGTATTRLIGLAIDVPVPPNRFWGIDQGSAQKLANNLQLMTDPVQAQQAIGILGSDNYDTNRYNLKALAFQAKGQRCSYLPDSSLFSRDKINVRDGHYPIWGTLHFFAAVSNGAFLSPEAEKFISLFGLSPLPLDLIDAFIDSSWIPECAMNVQRETELGDLGTGHPPAYPCGCYFDAKTSGKTPTGCSPCTTNDDCTDALRPGYDPARPACNFQFCEARQQ